MCIYFLVFTLNYKKGEKTVKQAFIEMKDIIKVFPPENIALKKVSFDIYDGEIHALIGENGAGKSTLMKVLYGLEKPGSGSIFINNKQVTISNPNEAVAVGIGMVHQEFMLIREYSVLENIVLGNESTKNGLLDMRKAAKKLEKIINDFKFDISIYEKVENISIAAQQKVEIVKQLYRNVHTLILDEPTAVLAPQEVYELFSLLRRIRNEGKTILFISHKLDEVLEISDRISVMRQGSMVWTRFNENLSKKELARAMVGRDVVFQVEKSIKLPGECLLQIEGLTVKNPNANNILNLNHVNFQVNRGEIVGIAGIEGNGQYELVNAIMGLTPCEGKIQLNGVDLSNATIRERRKSIAYVSQDRKISGSAQQESLVINLMMTHHYVHTKLIGIFNLFSQRKCNDFANEIIRKYQVKSQGIQSPIGSLSGGNQQKIIVGREFELDCNMLVIDQPVRGLDVGSIEYIHKKIIEKRNSGAGCLLVSADLDELFSLSDRIIVIYKGKLVAEKQPSDTTKEEIGEFMLGVRS